MNQTEYWSRILLQPVGFCQTCVQMYLRTDA